MAQIINEQKMMEDNMFEFEQKITSPLTRFLPMNFIPTDYYHISNADTTVDEGWLDVEHILGESSPIRFKFIEDLPIYMDNANILLELSEGDTGIDTAYEGEGTIVPGTIEPCINDHFIVKHLGSKFVFRMTSVNYDTILPDNYYKVGFTLSFISSEKAKLLDKQVLEKNTCLVEKIGTDEKCIIESEYYKEVENVEKMYVQIIDNYLNYFYNKRYNCILGYWGDGRRIFCPFLTEFVIRHNLFKYKRNQIDNLILTEQFPDMRRGLKYEQSIYRFIELKDKKKLTKFPFITFKGTNNAHTQFARWYDHSVDVVDIEVNMPDANYILTEEDKTVIELHGPCNSKIIDMINDYIAGTLTITSIPDTIVDDLYVFKENTLDLFFLTPIILYILKDMKSKVLAK